MEKYSHLLVAMAMMMVIISMSTVVESQVDHVVGGDRGWDRASDLKSWSLNRLFRVGDNIWFTFSAAEEGGISEVRSMEEFISCDVSNPIKMHTDGLNIVALHGEGIRYFVSNKPESCKQGLKLHVEVLPKTTTMDSAATLALAQGPTPSSAVTTVALSSFLLYSGLGLICL